MPPPSSFGLVVPADWPLVLENIEKALGEAVSQAAQRERDLEDNLKLPAAGAPGGAWQLHQAQMEERLECFRICWQEARARAAKVEAMLEAGETSVAQWLAAAEALRRRLANREIPTI